MIERYINQSDKECYKGVRQDTPLMDMDFHEPDYRFESDKQVALHTNIGSITVLDRMTGFGTRDIETGYRDNSGKFWLASGGYDVRESGVKTMREAISWIKEKANTCIGC